MLNILCPDTMMVKMVDQNTRKPIVKNAILDMVQNELGMDHHFLPQAQTVLVKVDAETMNNPILMEW